MRKLVAGECITLEGGVEIPEEWMGPYFTPELGQVIGSMMAAQDSMLLGRVTYEVFAAHWPNQTGDMADTMNGTPKYVVSGTLESADWQNTTLIPAAGAFAEIAKLKEPPGQNIGITGRGPPARLPARGGAARRPAPVRLPAGGRRGPAAVRPPRRSAAAEAPRLRDVR